MDQNSAIILYPNPVCNSLFLQADLPSPVSVHIVNAQGQEVFSLPAVDLRPGVQLDASQWPTGVYVCQIKNGEDRIMRTIVVE